METTEPDAWSIRSLLSAKLGEKVSFSSDKTQGTINFHTEEAPICTFFPEYDLLKFDPQVKIKSRELRHFCFTLCQKGFYIQFSSTAASL